MRHVLPIFLGASAAGLAYAVWRYLRTDQTASVVADDSSFLDPDDSSSWFTGTLDTAAEVGEYVSNLFVPRGIRNNNPGNIRVGNDWQGERANSTDTAFEQFTTPEYGIRALAKLLLKYQSAYGLVTVRAIITRWAPSNENDTAAYIAAVAKRMGISADTPVALASDPVKFGKLIAAIIQHENGQQPYTDAVIQRGIELA